MFNEEKQKAMKLIITNYRYWVLGIIGCIIVVGLIAVPQVGLGILAYTAILLGTKLVALLALVLYFILYLHWKDNNKIPELTSITGEEE